ncbi:MAG: hypothetical protein V1769_02965 [Thermoplasmatota archaeon]
MIARIVASFAILSILMISYVNAQPAIQTEQVTNDPSALVLIKNHFTAGQPYDFPYNSWVFIDEKFMGHTVILGNWYGMVSLGNHTIIVTRKGYSNSASITVEYTNQYFYIQLF